MDKKFSYVAFDEVEGKIVLDKLSALLAENSADIECGAFITENGTLAARMNLVKKVELVPKTPPVIDAEIIEPK